MEVSDLLKVTELPAVLAYLFLLNISVQCKQNQLSKCILMECSVDKTTGAHRKHSKASKCMDLIFFNGLLKGAIAISLKRSNFVPILKETYL